LRITTVPLAMAAPLTVTIFALRIAMEVGSGCANAGAPHSASVAIEIVVNLARFFIMQSLIIEVLFLRRAVGHR
jgi:hypothetical protein